MPNPDTLVNIVGNTGAPTDPTTGQYLPYIAAAHYGSGSVLLTSGDSGCDINDYCGGGNAGSGGNSGSICGTNLKTAHSEDLKFLYNSVNWGSSNSSYRRNDRRTADSQETVDAPLLPSFNFASLYRTADRVKSKTAPLIANGLMYVTGIDTSGGNTFATGGTVTVRCYDTTPFGDYDRDGNYDDGLADVSLGLPTMKSGVTRREARQVPAAFTSSRPRRFWQRFRGRAAIRWCSERKRRWIKSSSVGPDGTLYIFPAAMNLGTGSIPPTVSPIMVASDSGGVYDPTATHGCRAVAGRLRRLGLPDRAGRTGSRNRVGRHDSLAVLPRRRRAVQDRSDRDADGRRFANHRQFAHRNQLRFPHQRSDVLCPGGNHPHRRRSGQRADSRLLAGNAQRGSGLYAERRRAGHRNDGGNRYAHRRRRRLAACQRPLHGRPLFTTSSGQVPFVTPSVRVYSDITTSTVVGGVTTTTTRTARENYELGIVSPSYFGTFVTDAGGNFTGQVEIQVFAGAPAGTPPPGLLPGRNGSILASVDYDVAYISPAVTPNKPTNYDAFPTGARNDPNLVIPTYISKTADSSVTAPLGPGTPGGGIDTASFTPDDLLIFGTDQGILPATGTGTTPINWLTSIHALHEQTGATQLIWRYGLHDPGTADGSADGQNIGDNAPIFNYNKVTIDAGTLTVEPPVQPNALPEFISGLRVLGSPISTKSGLTYIMATGQSTASTSSGSGAGTNYGVNPYGLNQGQVTVLMCLQSNPTITLTLPISFDGTMPVQVSQVNALDSTSVVTANAANGIDGSSQLRIDAQRGKVTLLNFNATGGQFSASQSFVVGVTPIGQQTPILLHGASAAAVGEQRHLPERIGYRCDRNRQPGFRRLHADAVVLRHSGNADIRAHPDR